MFARNWWGLAAAALPPVASPWKCPLRIGKDRCLGDGQAQTMNIEAGRISAFCNENVGLLRAEDYASSKRCWRGWRHL
jgi:hypothetical protein